MQSNKKCKHIKFIMISLVLLILAAPGLFGCDDAESKELKTYETTENGQGISLENDGGEDVPYVNFYNKVDGYKIDVPSNMTVNMSMSSILAVLESKKLRIEIYNQMFSNENGVTVENYTDYSNQFLKNEVDHKVTYIADSTHDKWNVKIAEWERETLKHIENDKNYYASVEIIINSEESMTFLFKSAEPFFTIGGKKSYMYVIDSFNLKEATEKPYFTQLKEVDNSFRNKETQITYEKYFGDEATLSWGIFEKEAPLSFRKLVDIEEALNYEFPIVLYYTGIIEGEKFHPKLEPALKNASAHNKIVELTLQTLPQDNTRGNMVYDVLNGKYEEYLKNYIKVIKDYGKPILFRPGNEMNGDWCSYSAYHTSKDTEVYKAFYKYLYKLFKEGGADNVIWVWNPNGKSYPDFKWNDAFCYYPGDEYVDIIGMTNYNTGTYYEGESWMKFKELYDSLYARYSSVSNKPFMITEFASSSIGGDKTKWVKNMFEHIKTYDELKVAVWWSSCDYDSDGNISRPYFLDETNEILQEFKDGLAQPSK